jgi:hypothetical protein
MLKNLKNGTEPSMTRIATSSWFVKLDPDVYCRVGISRGVPRGQSGFRRYSKLNPGPWFNRAAPERYLALYTAEILTPLDPQTVVNDLVRLAEGKIPTLLCWEPSTPGEKWCHRGIVSAWLKDTLDLDVFEVGQEQEGCGWSHPKLPPLFRKS